MLQHKLHLRELHIPAERFDSLEEISCESKKAGPHSIVYCMSRLYSTDSFNRAYTLILYIFLRLIAPISSSVLIIRYTVAVPMDGSFFVAR